jgi:hypothetical protein
MSPDRSPLLYGASEIPKKNFEISGEVVDLDGRRWYRIANYDAMEPFFMTLTNPENHWVFISSTGGLSAGRINRDHTLFPYTTDDKVRDGHCHTGGISRFIVTSADGSRRLWRPLETGGVRPYAIQRNLYKSDLGDALIFEEINNDLGLRFSVAWETSPEFGIHRKCTLENIGGEDLDIAYLDGIRNIMPAGVSAGMQQASSNLLDAYKRSEAHAASGLGIYALSATLTDLAEPSESLLANAVWGYGLEGSTLLLSEEQLVNFESDQSIHPETDMKGVRGAYIQSGQLQLNAGQSKTWGLVGEVDLDHSDAVELIDRLETDRNGMVAALISDIAEASRRLEEILEINDGNQSVGSIESQLHHQANVMFNIMRGGYFIRGYKIHRDEFLDFIRDWNREAYAGHEKRLRTELPEEFDIEELRKLIDRVDDDDIRRLAAEYLPLTFSRRHGDPSRPWNMFSIHTRDEEGNPAIGYQGNWRDIFQNWEALCTSYPAFYPSVISKFLNATTIDGYNPYRISHRGVDWEAPEPDDLWSNIGYWSDHQIVYLSLLIEQLERYLPERVKDLMQHPVFVHADVPYRIAPWEEIVADPYDTITFDEDRHRTLEARVQEIGADGRLLRDASGEIHRSSFFEKLLILLLAKTANYVPGGGIWMNTQRPEWNDANNALAGWGLSMVTLAYLVNFIELMLRLMENSGDISMNRTTLEWLEASIAAIDSAGEACITHPVQRWKVTEKLGMAATAYRSSVYGDGPKREASRFANDKLAAFLVDLLAHFRSSIEATRREDGSFESYQVLKLKDGAAHVAQLYPMLEGQVSGLSIKGLEPKLVADIVDILKNGPLYREDQHSYMLYPNRDLPGFLEKNQIDPAALTRRLCAEDMQTLEGRILKKDSRGNYHFPGNYRNARDLEKDSNDLSPELRTALLELFEDTFSHNEFTGRSGTFFAYEGLGSIYWHMVSKLLLAVQEQLNAGVAAGAARDELVRVKRAFEDLRRGIGFTKTPAVYGAFPTDPYSHTPWGKGARQPGMTGQVKEEVLTRPAELGLTVESGRIVFRPELILNDQWRPGTDDYIFSFCGTKIRVIKSDSDSLKLETAEGSVNPEGLTIPAELSREIFLRSGKVKSIEVKVDYKRIL